MGAVTTLLYGSNDSDFAGLIADSPFSNLKDLALELAMTKVSSLPRFLIEAALSLINNSIHERAGFRFESIDLTELVPHMTIPAVFVASPDDKLVRWEHSKKLIANY